MTRGEGDGGVAGRGPRRGRSSVPALPAGGPTSPSPSVPVVVHPGGLGVVVGGVVAAAAGSPVVVGRGVAAAPAGASPPS